MLSGNIRKDRIIAVTNVLIAYSTTDLWLYAHTFLYEFKDFLEAVFLYNQRNRLQGFSFGYVDP